MSILGALTLALMATWTPAQAQKPQEIFFSPAPDSDHTVLYDAKTQRYLVYDRVGNVTVGRPRVMTREEYGDFRRQESLRSYWDQKRREKGGETAGDGLLPKFHVGGENFDRIFGSNVIEIIPQGSAELLFGISRTNTENYTIPEDMRANTTFDFDTKLQVNLTGRVGDKLQMEVKYNTEATFDFEQNVMVGYAGNEDEIIQKIEAGNVALPLPGTLITGSQSLFGFRTDLKFGNLNMSTIISQRKGQSQSIEVKGGAQTKNFELRADEYEANRHFFLSHYFYDTYDRSLAQLPLVTSGVEVTRVEVWVTNKRGRFESSRDLVAFVDLGENAANIFAKSLFSPTGSPPRAPDNGANTLYEMMSKGAYAGIRQLANVTPLLDPLRAQNFRAGQDYEKLENARLLSPSEYTLNSRLGFISLNMALNSDEVLAVAYEYTFQGRTYRVGEFSTDGVEAPNALILKLLKGTDLSPNMPTWHLMMKNIYALGDYQISPQHFLLDVLYQDDEIGTPVNYMTVGAVRNTPLLSVLNLDNLNGQGDAGPDGIFDFVEGVTMLSSTGRLIFPATEPFGRYLAAQLGDPELAREIAYTELYDSTLTVAQQLAEKNKFSIQGEYRGANSSEIPLNAPNVPKGSVVVTAGGKRLVENTDYVVDYLLGTVRIINQGLLESGTPINISLESNLGIDFQVKTMVGTHLDYQVNDRFNVGATVLNLTERPMTKKVNYGNEAMSNTIWGLNTSYETELPWLTRAIDALPLLDTKETSVFSVQGEFAQLIPGQSRHLDKRASVYLDDFEANKSTIDLRMWSAWTIASVPQGQPTFPEGDLVNDLDYGKNRARLAWYTIDPLFLRNSSLTPVHIRNNPDAQSSHFVREVEEKEIFPNRNTPQGQPTTIPVLNVAFYPEERGPYNFDSKRVNADGTLQDPTSRWGGMMRALPITDFEHSNIEYIEFWLMDPFVEDSQATGGELLLNLGNISEDILRDGRKSYENGLPIDGDETKIDWTVWGKVPSIQSSVMAFDNDPKARSIQDVGLDGLTSEEERAHYLPYLSELESRIGAGEALEAARRDPASDDYRYFRSSLYDERKTGILDRYKYFNSTEGNSPTTEQSPESYPTSSTTLPDVEDLNRDNTLADNESYYQYRVQLRPQALEVGQNCITDKIVVKTTFANGVDSEVAWYQFKVPIKEFESRVGHIQNFKSVRFIRLMLRGFDRPVVLRFASLGLVRGEWRRYDRTLLEPTEVLGGGGGEATYFDVSAVNIEENSTRTPVNYVLPPKVTREIDASQAVENELNEQAMELKVLHLRDGDARAAYRNVSYDLRQYRTLAMDVHAEAIAGEPLRNGELSVFLRLGSDYTSNYYEYEVPLTLTEPGFYSNSHEADREAVWPRANAIEFDMEVLRDVKLARDDARRAQRGSFSARNPFRQEVNGRIVTVVGYPTLSKVRVLMVGVRNRSLGHLEDDGYAKSGVVWVNELRLSRLGARGGWAALAAMNTKLADFGMLSLTGGVETPGFGSLESRVNDRSKETAYQYDASGNFELGKFFPRKWQVSIPVFLGFGETYRNPQYNPLDEDVPFEDALNHLPKGRARDSLRHIAQDFTRRTSINLTNIRVAPEPTDRNERPHMWDPQNFTVSYAYTEENARNVRTEYRDQITHRGSFAYAFNARPIVIEPLRQVSWTANRYLRLFNEFNFSPLPRQVTFRTEVNRTYLEQRLRNINSPMLKLEPTFAKGFDWNRSYSLNWDLMRSLRLDFSANNLALIDEPEGPVRAADDPSVRERWRDSVWQSARHLGRTTQYNHHLGVNYQIPINKLPFLEWLSASGSYNADYRWDAAPILADRSIQVGNTIQNSNSIQLTGQASLASLYGKVPFLQRVNSKFERLANGQPLREKPEFKTVNYVKESLRFRAGRPRTLRHNLSTEDVRVRVLDAQGKVLPNRVEIKSEDKVEITLDEDVPKARVEIEGKKPKSAFSVGLLAEGLVRVAMGLRSVSASYTETNGTFLPGYMPETVLLGNSKPGNQLAPGVPFVLGWQDPDFAWKAVRRDWLTPDSTMLDAFKLTRTQNFSYRISFEPFPYFRIEITGNRTFSRNRSSYFRPEGGAFTEINPVESGNFSISTVMIQTAFQQSTARNGYVSEAFGQFAQHRAVVARRRAEQRGHGPRYNPTQPSARHAGYPDGYGPLSQDVLLPAMLAAYTGQNPESISLGEFPRIPLPNWQLTYDGLSRIKAIQPYIRQLSLRHGYRATYNIGSFQTAEQFAKDAIDGFTYVRNMQEDFISRYVISNVSLSEQFSPLVGIDLTFVNTLSTKFEVRKNRTLSMSFTNNQMTDMDSWEYVVGAGYRFEDMPLVMKTQLGGKQVVKSELRLQADFGIRNTATILRKLNEGSNTPTAGQWSYSIKLSADYMLSEQITVRAFFDRMVNRPLVSLSFPNSTTSFGISLRFTLDQ